MFYPTQLLVNSAERERKANNKRGEIEKWGDITPNWIHNECHVSKHTQSAPSQCWCFSFSLRAQLLCQTGEVHTEQTLLLKSWLSSVWVGDARYPVLAIRQKALTKCWLSVSWEYSSCLAGVLSLVFLAWWLTQGLVKTVKLMQHYIIIYFNNG